MDFERIYNKLESIDGKLTKHMVTMERRVTAVEEQNKNTKGAVKTLFAIVLSSISAAATYVVKLFISHN